MQGGCALATAIPCVWGLTKPTVHPGVVPTVLSVALVLPTHVSQLKQLPAVYAQPKEVTSVHTQPKELTSVHAIKMSPWRHGHLEESKLACNHHFRHFHISYF